MVNATYHQKERFWKYIPRETAPNFTDCNILLLKKDAFAFKENEIVKMISLPQYEASLDEYFKLYVAIHQFYCELYGRNSATKDTLVFFPEDREWQGDGYKRANLIAMACPPSFTPETKHTLAHEMGHQYGCGANVESWEDWLNETTAEWSALLYDLHNDALLFKSRIELHFQAMKGKALNLRENGDNRPNDVHDVGTLIYYKIFVKHGEPAIVDLLRAFDQCKTKTTDCFIKQLVMNGKNNLAEEISSHLS